MSSTTAEITITELRKLFATHGLPTQVITDNGPQFTSQGFEVFLQSNGIHKSAPYHPATNGEAERYVQTFKQAMRAAKGDSGTLSTKLMRFLLSYRTTPNATTGVNCFLVELYRLPLFVLYRYPMFLVILQPIMQGRYRYTTESWHIIFM